MKVLDILKLTNKEKEDGVWVSGTKYEGEFRWWYENGQVAGLYFHRGGLLHGIIKNWSQRGELITHMEYHYGEIKKVYV